MDRRLTPTGPVVSALSLGSWHTWERMRFDEAVAVVRRAVEAGVTYLDVSRYDPSPDSPLPQGSPHTESVLGRILAASGLPRHAYQLGVKVWYDHPEQSIAEHLAESMLRLDTEYVDVVSTAYPERHGLDTPQLVEELASIVLSGRARSWGGGNWSPDRLAEIAGYARDHGLPGPVILQQKYSVGRRTVVEDPELARVCAEFGVRIHAADVLEGGVLLGKGNRMLARDPGGVRERITGYAEDFRAAAESLGTTPARLALAYCLRNPLVASVLVGVSSREQLEDDLGAVALAAEQGDALEEAVAPFAIPEHVLDPY